MIEIRDKMKCSGCGACRAACPADCIEMRPDGEGFRYPVADAARCVGCGRCERVCPVLNPPAVGEDAPSARLVRTRNAKQLAECTSGGAFTALASDVVKGGGVAWGAAFDDDFNVVHTRVDRPGELHRLSGSKYVQSETGDAFRWVRVDLDAGREVIFCGTPCQAAGLKNYLSKDYENLLLVDLVCHGVPSPKLWRAYLDLIQRERGRLEYANFRSKRLGYHVSVMEERFEGGGTRIGSARTNLMSKCFFQNAADRPICYACPFKTAERCGDLTLFDGWHAASLVPGLRDDDRGYTCALIQSAKGGKALEACEGLERHEIDAREALRLDGVMALKSVRRPESRDRFYALLEAHGVDGAVARLFPISRRDHAVERVKQVLNRLGVLGLAKKLKG